MLPGPPARFGGGNGMLGGILGMLRFGGPPGPGGIKGGGGIPGIPGKAKGGGAPNPPGPPIGGPCSIGF